MSAVLVWVLFEIGSFSVYRPSVRLATVDTAEECERVKKVIATKHPLQCVQIREVKN